MDKEPRNSPDNSISGSESVYDSDQENIAPQRPRHESSPTPSLAHDGGTVTAAAQTFTIHEDALPERQEVRITSVQVPIRQKISDLQDRVFRTVVPEEGFTVKGTNSIRDQSRASASISDRVQTAVEIIHVRPEKYGEELAKKILEMPRGDERMEAIEKLGPIFDKLPQTEQYRLASIAKHGLYEDESSSPREALYAHKFLTIVRDHLSKRDQDYHEYFNKSVLEKKSRQAVSKRLIADLAKSISERSDIDDRLSQNEAKILAMVNEAEMTAGRFERTTDLTEEQNLELRKSAYILRRVTEQLDNQNVRDNLTNNKKRPISEISDEAPQQPKKQKTLDPAHPRAFPERGRSRDGREL